MRLKALRRVLLAQPPELGQSGSSLGAVQDLLKVVASTHRALLLDALGEVRVSEGEAELLRYYRKVEVRLIEN